MQLSGQILKARDLGQTIERPSSRGELREITEGYEVYREVDALLRQSGYTRVGRKIGFSNKATWNEFGLDSPIWAYVYDRTVAFAPGRGRHGFARATEVAAAKLDVLPLK